MANTYTQLYFQFVFVVKGRQNAIAEEHREKLEKYMCGIVKNNKSKPLAIYCNPDHTHILISLDPSVSISSIARDVKANSSKWINEKNWISKQFSWQRGYGAFSYSKSQVDRVVKYIQNQAEHHKKKKLKDEYKEILKKRKIPYDDKYLFEWYDNPTP